LRYAGRVVDLASARLDVDLEPRLLAMLRALPSNDADWKDGRRIYERRVVPARMDLAKVAAHYAVASLFRSLCREERFHGFEIAPDDHGVHESGRAKLAAGAVRVRNSITGAWSRFSVGALHFGDHNLITAVRAWPGQEVHGAIVAGLTEAFGRADLPEVVRRLDRAFPEGRYALEELFPDLRREVVENILAATVREVETELERLYVQHEATLRFLDDLDAPLPEALGAAAEFVLTRGLRRAFGAAEPDLAHIRRLVETAARHRVRLHDPRLRRQIERCLEHAGRDLGRVPDHAVALEHLLALLEVVLPIGAELNLHRLRVIYDRIGVGRGELWARLGRLLGFASGRVADVPLPDPPAARDRPATSS